MLLILLCIIFHYNYIVCCTMYLIIFDKEPPSSNISGNSGRIPVHRLLLRLRRLPPHILRPHRGLHLDELRPHRRRHRRHTALPTLREAKGFCTGIQVSYSSALYSTGLGKILLKCITDTDTQGAVSFRYLDTDTIIKSWLKMYLRYRYKRGCVFCIFRYCI